MLNQVAYNATNRLQKVHLIYIYIYIYLVLRVRNIKLLEVGSRK